MAVVKTEGMGFDNNNTGEGEEKIPYISEEANQLLVDSNLTDQI